MPFHVEIRRSLRRAWAFNLDEQQLRRTVVEPWHRRRAVVLGDHEWDPRECTLKILEGPKLQPSDLAHGRGWHNAERSARDVTAAVLGVSPEAEELAVAVLAERSGVGHELTEQLGQLGVRTIDWAAVRARLLAAATVVADPPLDAGALAVVVVIERPDPAAGWLFQVGLALGALGGRAIVVQIGDHAPPSELSELGVFRLDLRQPASLHALAGRLRFL
jgi:hypothetical protein